MKKTFLILFLFLSTFFIKTNSIFAKQRDDILCGTNNESVETAIGCIPTGDTNQFIAFILRWGIGIGGGISFFLILLGGFQVMTSNGIPEKIQAGKELISSAITGLLLLIFSIFVLKLVGVDILGLDKFGFGG